MRYVVVLVAMLLGDVARADCERFTTRVEDLARLIAGHPSEERRGEKSELAAVLKQLDACRDKSKAEEARAEKTRSDPQAVRVIEGATACMLRSERAATLREIATEQKYARVGGVQNNSKLYGLQRRLRAIDEATVTATQEAKSRPEVKPAPCTDATVRRVLECNADTSSGACDDDTKYLVRFLPSLSSDE